MKQIAIIIAATLTTAALALAGIKCYKCKGSGWDGNFRCLPCGGDGEIGN